MFNNEPGWRGAFTRQQVEGAIPNGTRITKCGADSNDPNPLGTGGVVLGSLCHDGKFLYFVEWDTMPRTAVGVLGWKIKEGDHA